MPKIIFDSKNEIPEHLRDDAKEVDGKFELDAKGVLDKNKELLKDNKKLKLDNESLQAEKEAAEDAVTEAKSKVNIPRGKRLVDADVAELGEAAKTASLSSSDISNLKTKVDEFEREKKEEEVKNLKTRAFNSAGISNTDLALSLRQSDDLEFESEMKDGKEIFYRVVEKDGKKEKMLFDNNYVKSLDGFKDVFAQLSTTKEKKTPFTVKETETSANIFDRIREGEKKRVEGEARTVDQAFGFN